MSLTIPAFLAVIALIVAMATYRSIRRGGARFYTLEREAVLRRASFMLLVSVAFFLGAIGLLIYDRQQLALPSAADGGAANGAEATPTATVAIEAFPPTPTGVATLDPNLPPPTPTSMICRAVVEGTSGSGLTLRESPGGPEIRVLLDGTILILMDTEPVQDDNFLWRQVRTVSGDEGWAADEFLTISDDCQ
jgi:hypothetical protein